jgi:hypothetical protein
MLAGWMCTDWGFGVIRLFVFVFVLLHIKVGGCFIGGIKKRT